MVVGDSLGADEWKCLVVAALDGGEGLEQEVGESMVIVWFLEGSIGGHRDVNRCKPCKLYFDPKK